MAGLNTPTNCWSDNEQFTHMRKVTLNDPSIAKITFNQVKLSATARRNVEGVMPLAGNKHESEHNNNTACKRSYFYEVDEVLR